MISHPRRNCKFKRNITIYCLHEFEGSPYYRIGEAFNISTSRVQQICDRVTTHIHDLDATYIMAVSEWEDSYYGQPSSI